jgi:hypothetical protein
LKSKSSTKSKKTSSSTSSKDTKSIDFSGVQSGGRKKIPEGDYRFKVDKAYWDESEAGNDMVVFESVVAEGAQKGWRGWTYCAVTPKALWKLRQMLEALGVEVPEGKKLAVNPKKYIGLEHGGTVESEEYDGKKRSKITDIFHVDQLGDGEEEEEEETEEDDSEEEEEEEEESDDDDSEEEEEEEEDD